MTLSTEASPLGAELGATGNDLGREAISQSEAADMIAVEREAWKAHAIAIAEGRAEPGTFRVHNPEPPETTTMATLPPLVPLKSSMLKGYHYDPASRALTVQYQNGDTWQHEDVPMERAEAFSGAASAGAYFNTRIKGQYPGRKL